MAAILKNFSKVYSLDTLGVENFNEIALSLTVKEIEPFLCFCIFGENSKIQNGRHFGQNKNFPKLGRVYCLVTLWVENFDEIALSLTVKEIQALLCFFIFGENSKIQNGRHFKKFFENFYEIALSLAIKEIV